jgi:transcriptional regulator with GAF, ATPase, and Fis domain
MPAQPSPQTPTHQPGRPERSHVRAGLAELVLDVARTPATECDGETLLRQVCLELTELCGLAGCAAVVLDASTGAVHSVAGSHREAEQLTRLVRQLGESEGLTAPRGDSTVPAQDLTKARTVLAEAAGRVGLPVTAAVTLYGGHQLVGCLQLFGTEVAALSDELLRELVPLADVLGVALHNTEAYRFSATLVTELSEALDAQRPVEQAKGLLAERHQVDLDAAYRMLRDQARRRDTTVAAVAAELVGQSWQSPVREQTKPELSDSGNTPLPEQRGGSADRPETERHTTG